jgi:hypothetical protein
MEERQRDNSFQAIEKHPFVFARSDFCHAAIYNEEIFILQYLG